MTVRGTNFEKTKQGDSNQYPTEEVSGIDDILGSVQTSWVQNIVTKSEMAELTTAKYVISGGRALKSNDNFQMLYDIAETLGKENCAIGASRAAVDAGMINSDL